MKKEEIIRRVNEGLSSIFSKEDVLNIVELTEKGVLEDVRPVDSSEKMIPESTMKKIIVSVMAKAVSEITDYFEPEGFASSVAESVASDCDLVETDNVRFTINSGNYLSVDTSSISIDEATISYHVKKMFEEVSGAAFIHLKADLDEYIYDATQKVMNQDGVESDNTQEDDE